MIIFIDGMNHYKQCGYRVPEKGDFYLDRKGNCIRYADRTLDDDRIILQKVQQCVSITYREY